MTTQPPTEPGTGQLGYPPIPGYAPPPPGYAPPPPGYAPGPAKNGWKIALPIAVLAAIAAIVVAVLVGTGVIGGADDAKSDTEASTDSTAAAQAASEKVLGRAAEIACTPFQYDYKTLDADLAQAKTVLTGRALDDFTKFIDQTKTIATTSKATSKCQVDKMGLVNLDGDTAKVNAQFLISTTQDGSDSQSQTPRVDLTLQNVKGTWLISDIESP